MSRKSIRPNGRARLIEAASIMIRERGYCASSLEELCAWAGVSKGAFYYHFRSKDALATAALEQWSKNTGAVFASADYIKQSDPLDRLIGYVQFRKEILAGQAAQFSCLAGTLVQEVHDSHPIIRSAACESIFDHLAFVEKMIAEAKQRHRPNGTWQPSTLSRHIHAVLQGAFILAKAKQDLAPAQQSLDHLLNYLNLVFGRPATLA